MSTKAAAPSPPVILLVDDDSFVVRLYSARLEQAGFHTVAALDGMAAIEMLPRLSVDLIVLDLMLPKVHGLKVLEAIRADRRHRNTPVLILSNAYLPDMARKAMTAGANDGLLKSDCSPSHLVALAHKLIKRDSTQSAAVSESTKQDPASPSDPLSEGVVLPDPEPIDLSTDLRLAEELRTLLLKDGRREVATIRQLGLSYARFAGSDQGVQHLESLYCSIRSLSTRASLAGCSNIARLAAALEALLFEHVLRLNSDISPSAIQTVVQAVDCLEQLFAAGKVEVAGPPRKTRVLLVDDDTVCNAANKMVLQRANHETALATDGTSALELLQKNPFDLILLDINMPGMNGFEVCERLRRIPQHKDTPVIFVTVSSDFQSRAQSALSGGNALISKPISPLELIVKTTMFLARTTGRSSGHAPSPLSDATEPASENTSSKIPASPGEDIHLQQPEPDLGHVQTGHQPSPSSQLEAAATQTPDSATSLTESQPVPSTPQERLQALREALADEAKRRDALAWQAADNARRRSELESALAETQQAQQRFQQLLEQSADQLQKAQENQTPGRATDEGRRRELQGLRDFVERKLSALHNALANEAGDHVAVEEQAAESARLRSELKAALEDSLLENQQTTEALGSELASCESPERCSELEALLQQNQTEGETLQWELEQVRGELHALQHPQAGHDSQLELNARTFQLSQDAVEQPPDGIVPAQGDDQGNAHAQTTEPPQPQDEFESTPQTVQPTQEPPEHSSSADQPQWEQIVAAQDKAQAELREQLEAARNELQAQNDTLAAEHAKLDTQSREAEAQRADLQKQIQSLNEALSAETTRRQTAEQQTDALAKDRAQLETQLNQSRSQLDKSQAQLRAELEQAQKQLDAQQQNAGAEQAKLEAQVQQLQSKLADQNKAQAQLQDQLEAARNELQAQKDTLAAEQAKLDTQSRQADAQHADLQQQVQSLNEALNSETTRRQAAEQQTDALAKDRAQLETQLNQSRSQLDKSQAQLRAELEQAQKQLDAQQQNAGAEQAKLEAQVQQLQSQLADQNKAQAKLQKQLETARQELQAQKDTLAVEQAKLDTQSQQADAQRADLQKQIQSLNEALRAETTRRQTAEQQTDALAKDRAQLETQLSQSRSQLDKSQAQLRAELEQAQKQLDAQQRNAGAEQSRLEAQAQQLQSQLADQNKAQAKLQKQIQSLNEALNAETTRRQTAEQQTDALAKDRTQLETELSQSRSQLDKSQAQLRAELEQAQKQLDAQQQNAGAEQSRLEAQAQQLQSQLADQNKAKTELQGQLEAARTGLQSAKSKFTTRTARFRAQTRQLRSELMQQENAQVQLRTELEQAWKQLDARQNGFTAEQSKLQTEVRNLQSALDEQKKAQTHLQHELDAARAELQTHRDQLAEAHSELETRTREADAARAALEQNAAALNTTLTTETQRRKQMEQEAREADNRRKELETQLQASRRALESQKQDSAAAQSTLERTLSEQEKKQADLHTQLEAVRKQLRDQKDQIAGEHSTLLERTREVDAARTEWEQKVKTLHATLAAETQRREAAEQAAREAGQRPVALEAQLKENRRAQAELHDQLEQEHLQHRKLAERLADAERDKADLTREAKSAGEHLRTHQESLRTLQTKVVDQQAQLERLAVSLQTERTQRHLEQANTQRLENQLAEINDQLARKSAAELSLQQRESELESRLRQQKDQMTTSAASAAVQEAQIKHLQRRLEDLSVLKSSLCAQVEQLTAQHAEATERIGKLTEQSATAAQTVRDREQELAAWRYAVLDGARLGAQLNEERDRMKSDGVQGLNRLANTLLKTPLSVAQRELVAQVSQTLEKWEAERTKTSDGVELGVQQPVFRESEFNCVELVEAALKTVGEIAAKRGSRIPAGVIGWTPERARGHTDQIHQLITLLADALDQMPEAGQLDLEVSFQSKPHGAAEMHLNFHLGADSEAERLCGRLKGISVASTTLASTAWTASDVVLAAACQLALALGGTTRADILKDGKVRFGLSLPLEAGMPPDQPRSQPSQATTTCQAPAGRNSEIVN